MGLLEEVLEARAYRQAKAMVDGAKTHEAMKALPDTPFVMLAKVIDMELAQG